VDAPLFVALNATVARLAGLSVLGLRAAQAVFGVLAVVLLFRFLRRGPLASAAFPAALAAAGSPFLVFYSRDARPYSQLLFFTTAFAYAFDATRDAPVVRRRLLLAVLAILAVTSHYFAVVFLGTFVAVTLVAHARGGRHAALRADFVTGAVVGLAVAPCLLGLLVGLRQVSVPYWQISRVGVSGILAELFLLPGTTLPGGSRMPTLISVVVAVLVCVPLLHAAFRHRDLIQAEPRVSCLWWAAPGLVGAAGVLAGRNWLFYPRGFISVAPFLLAYWVSFTPRMDVRPWLRRLYATVLLVPFALNGLLVALQHPSQPYFRGRDILASIARDVEADRGAYDVVLIHHWWMAQFYYYYLSEPLKVRPLGRGREGPTAARDDLAAVPPQARVLLVVNDLARSQSGSEASVVAALRASRPLVRERPCLFPSLRAGGLVCTRIYLFGPAQP
jgi:hypothetical protein